MSRAQEMPFRKLGDNASDDQSAPPLDPNQPDQSKPFRAPQIGQVRGDAKT